jgi:hypothetical protein
VAGLDAVTVARPAVALPRVRPLEDPHPEIDDRHVAEGPAFQQDVVDRLAHVDGSRLLCDVEEGIAAVRLGKPRIEPFDRIRRDAEAIAAALRVLPHVDVEGLVAGDLLLGDGGKLVHDVGTDSSQHPRAASAPTSTRRNGASGTAASWPKRDRLVPARQRP